MKTYSPEITEAIRTYIKETDLHMVSFDEELGRFSFNMQLPTTLSSVHIIIRVGERDFSTAAVCPIRPDTNDAALMAKTAEFVCRANYGLKNGSFEFDFSDGELRYKCFVPCDDHVPSRERIRQSITVPAGMLRRYSAGIIGVLYNGMDPADMVRKCEEDSIGHQVYNEMKRSRREFLMRYLDRTAAQAEASGALPTFDEFIRADSRPDAESAEPAEPNKADSGEGDSSKKPAE